MNQKLTEKLKEALSEYGTVLVCRVDYVVTILLKSEKAHVLPNFIELSNKVTLIALNYPLIEVMKTEEDLLFIVLKPKYRPLTNGEVIVEGDQAESHKGGWCDVTKLTIGDNAPDPSFVSHRKFRRLIK